MTEPKDIEALNLKLGRRESGHSLDPIPRSLCRRSLEESLPDFYGADLWNAYEVGFLLPSGKPVVYHMRLQYDADTPYMIESKSLKLFLNAQSGKVFDGADDFKAHVSAAVSLKVAGAVALELYGPDRSPISKSPPGLCVDDLDVPDFHGKIGWTLDTITEPGEYALYSHLLRTNCPVTNQPDWGCVSVMGRGKRKPEPASFLAYIVSFRGLQEFHETCCEKIFADLYGILEPEFIEVTCYYTRRGGLDINPRRATREIGKKFFGPVWRQ